MQLESQERQEQVKRQYWQFNMENVIFRKNKLFVLDKEKLKPHAKKDEIYTALYAAIYTEFQGASKHPNYKDLTNLDKVGEVNSFAYKWLKQRGYI